MNIDDIVETFAKTATIRICSGKKPMLLRADVESFVVDIREATLEEICRKMHETVVTAKTIHGWEIAQDFIRSMEKKAT